jgi:hypothetical protein
MKDPNPGMFFPWLDNKKGDITNGIVIRQLSVRARREIDAQTIEEEIKYIDGRVYERGKVIDEDLRTLLVNDYCIVSWTGLLDEEGHEIPCTTANKVWAMTECLDVSVFVVNSLVKLAELMTGRAEEKRKN